MEKVISSSVKNIHGKRVYVDGLEKIIGILQNNGEEIEIKTEEYVFEDLQELEKYYENNEGPEEISIVSRNPYLRIRFRKDEISIYLDQENPERIVIRSLIEEEIRKWNRKFSFTGNWYLFWICLLIYFALSRRNIETIGRETYLLLAAPVSIVTIIVFVYKILSDFTKFGRPFVLKRVGRDGGFFVRNKDTLLVALISAIVGSVCTILASKILEWI